MLASDFQIEGLAQSGVVYPYNPNNLKPSSLDLTLGNEFIMNVGAPDEYGEVLDDWERFRIQPREFVLAHTVEILNLPLHVTVTISGKSSWGRKGLFTENAGHAEAGFRGQITLELFNASRNVLELPVGSPICQAIFNIHEPAKMGYGDRGGHYQDQMGAVRSVL